MKDTWADITKAKSILGWQPRVSLEEGVKRTVAWHIENRQLINQIEIDLTV